MKLEEFAKILSSNAYGFIRSFLSKTTRISRTKIALSLGV